MTDAAQRRLDPRTRAAVREIQQLILRRYPQAAFEVTPGPDDPESTHLVATIDVEDTDEVLDVVIDRLLDLQVEDHLPVHVIPVRPAERGGGGAAPMRQPASDGRGRLAALLAAR